MPYRRLPNTDISRIKALNTAIGKSSDIDFKDLAVSAKTLSDAKSIVRKFEQLILRYQQTFDTQVKANIVFQSKVKTARLYVSHFIQVLYMSVLRSEIKSSQLKLYKLHNLDLTLPDLSTNDLLLEWGKNIIEGEQQRISQGGVPIYNPGIAKVNVMLSQFREGYQTQKIHQKATNRVQEEVSKYRDEVDRIIVDIWDDVERYNSTLEQHHRVRKNKEYGIIYYYRKGETIENGDD